MTALLPALHPWHVPVLRLVVQRPGISTSEIGRALYGKRDTDTDVARHELQELRRMRLVASDGAGWSPALFAAETLRQAESKPRRRKPQ
jgi:hypothetical protein